MSVIAKVSLGPIGYTDWLRVTAAPVSDEFSLVFEQWYDVPGPTFILVTLPNPVDYILKFYDAPTNGAAGLLLQPSLIVNGLDATLQLEERWYEIGNMPGSATLDATGKIITDPYLNGKEVFQYDKEGMRPLKAPDEIELDNVANTITFKGALDLSSGEKFRILIKNIIGVASSGGGFAGTVDVTDQNYTISISDSNKRFRLVGSAATQVINLPKGSLMPADGFVYLDNNVGGTAVQPVILTDGMDRVLYNGLNVSLGQFAEIWVSKGRSLQLQWTGTFWEIIGSYDGDSVGERFAGTNNATNAIPEDGRLMDGDEYPRLYYYIRNILPATHYVTDSNVTNSGYTHFNSGNDAKAGQFIIHPTLKKFIMPNTQNLSERGSKSFTTFGADTGRVYDYPGGIQEEMEGPHNHPTFRPRTDAVGVQYEVPNKIASGSNRGLYTGDIVNTGTNSGTENRVKNFSVIFLRRI